MTSLVILGSFAHIAVCDCTCTYSKV